MARVVGSGHGAFVHVSYPYCLSHRVDFVIFFFVDETQGFVRRRKKVAEREADIVARELEDGERPLPH